VPEIDVTPLDTSLWPGLSEMFAQGGDPKNCWCTFWRFPNAQLAPMSTDDKRAWLHNAATTHDARSAAPGLVAHEGGRALGWVSVAPRGDYGRLAKSRTIPRIDGDDVWSVVCFAIGREGRGRGLSTRLLAEAAQFATAGGAGVLEAYPVAVPAGARIPAAAAYSGVESLFLAAGFSRVAETTSSAAGYPRVVVRRTLHSPQDPAILRNAGPSRSSPNLACSSADSQTSRILTQPSTS
jgi:GNAT superfamily N-acetyltransferase